MGMVAGVLGVLLILMSVFAEEEKKTTNASKEKK